MVGKPSPEVETLIADARESLTGITPGAWVAEDGSGGVSSAWGVMAIDEHGEGRSVVLHDFVSQRDAEFIAAAPRIIHGLLSALASLRGAAEKPQNPMLSTTHQFKPMPETGMEHLCIACARNEAYVFHQAEQRSW